MTDKASPQFDNPSPITGENLILTELNANDRARIQSDMDLTPHVVSGFSDNTIPRMVELLPYSPHRIEEAQPYYELRHKTVNYDVVRFQIEELWKQKPITSRVKLNDYLEIEPLQTNYEVVVGIEGETTKIAYSPDCDAENIVQVVKACQKGKEVAAQFGIEEASPNHILLITSQLPLVDSHYNPFDNVTHVGCRGINNFERSDELAGIAHEETHAKFDATLQKYFKIIGSRRSECYPWAVTLEFLDEGLATTAQQAILNKPAVSILKANFEDMHPRLKEHLRQGKYEEQWLYDYTMSKQNRAENIDPVFRSDTHARYLPGAFIEYCLGKGYKLQDLMKVLFDRLEQAKPEIAKALDIEARVVVLDHEQLLFSVMDKIGIPRTERKNRFDLEDKVYAEMERARLTPFQILASLERNTESQTIMDFLKWVEK